MALVRVAFFSLLTLFSVNTLASNTVIFETSRGNMTLELYPEKAPQSVDNFLYYVDSGFYNDTVFHRVIPGFVIQGGGFTETMTRKQTQAPIKNESNNGLKNTRTTLSMARLPDPHSATSQFFINLNDNHNLDFRNGNHGYAVFAIVIEGQKVMDDIARQKTGKRGRYSDVPLEPIKIIKAYRDKTDVNKANTAGGKPANKSYTAQ